MFSPAEITALIRLTQGELSISDGLTIDGSSVGGVVITGDADGDDVTLAGTHITDVTASLGGTAGAADDLLDDNSRVLNSSPLSIASTLNLNRIDHHRRTNIGLWRRALFCSWLCFIDRQHLERELQQS